MWSFGGLFIKFVDLSPLAITGLRSLGAAIVLWIYLKTPRWQWKPYFIIGVISYVGMMIMYVISIRMTSADRKSTRLNSSHSQQSRMPSSA